MVTVAEAFVSIRPDFGGFSGEVQRGLSSTSAGLRGVEQDAERADKKVGGLGGTLGNIGKTAAGVATGFIAFQGLASVTGLISGTIGAASNLNETLSKSNTVFREQGGAIESWASTAARGFGQSKEQALAAASSFGNMFTQLGIATPQAAEMSTAMVELASDFASFHNADITEVLTAQQAAFRGEYDALQRFVPTINAANVEQRALAMTGKATTKELTAQEKALATQALMLEGAGDAMGDFDRTSSSLANRQRILSAEWSNMQAQLGAALLPVLVSVAGFILSDLIPAISTVANTLSAVLGPALGFITENREPLVAALLAIGAAILTVLVPATIAWVAAEWAKVAALTAAAIAFLAANAPLILIAAAIGGLIAVVFLLIKHWDDITAKVPILGHAFDFVRSLIEGAMNSILGIVSFVWPFISQIITTEVAVWTAVLTTAWGIISSIVGAAIDFIRGLIEWAWPLISQIIATEVAVWSAIISTAWGIISGIVEGAVNFVKGLIEWAWPLISHIINTEIAVWTAIIETAWGIISGIFNAVVPPIVQLVTDAWNFISSVTLAVWEAISFFIHEVLGRIWRFISDTFNTVRDFIRDTLDEVWRIVSGAWDAIWRTINDILDQIWRTVVNAFNAFVQVIIDHVQWAKDEAWTFATGILDTIWGVLKGLWQTGKDAVGQLVEGIVNSGIDVTGQIGNWVKGAIPGAIRSVLGIDSPSRVMRGLGINLVEGLIQGIKDKLPGLASSAAAIKGMFWNVATGVGGVVKNAAGQALDAAGNILGGIGGFLGIGGGGGGGDVERWRGLVAQFFPGHLVNRMLGVMAAESGGNPLAQNKASAAAGLFQIMPFWAPEFGVPYAALFDPTTNVRLAAEILRRQGLTAWEVVTMGIAHSGLDFVPKTAPYLLERGEAVIPAAQNRGAREINVTVNQTGPIYTRDEAEARQRAGDVGFALGLRLLGANI